jgi:hypothetical protein
MLTWTSRKDERRFCDNPTRRSGMGQRLSIEQLEDRALLAGDLGFAVQLGGPSTDLALGIAVDSSGNVYTTGRFHGTVDFDPGAGTKNLTSAGSDDIFVSKLDSVGNFVWAISMGGSNSDQGRGISVDSSGNVYTTGAFQGTSDFDPGAGTANLTSAGDFDAWRSKWAVRLQPQTLSASCNTCSRSAAGQDISEAITVLSSWPKLLCAGSTELTSVRCLLPRGALGRTAMSNRSTGSSAMSCSTAKYS